MNVTDIERLTVADDETIIEKFEVTFDDGSRLEVGIGEMTPRNAHRCGLLIDWPEFHLRGGIGKLNVQEMRAVLTIYPHYTRDATHIKAVLETFYPDYEFIVKPVGAPTDTSAPADDTQALRDVNPDGQS